MLKSDIITRNLIKSQPELINIAIQSPTEFLTESNVQPIFIAAVGAFTVTANMAVVKLVSDIIALFGSPGESSSSEFNIRKYLHLVSNGLINLSWEASKISMVEDDDKLELTWPQGRICTSGMSNLSTDVDLPAFIALPIHLVQGMCFLNYLFAEEYIYRPFRP